MKYSPGDRLFRDNGNVFLKILTLNRIIYSFGACDDYYEVEQFHVYIGLNNRKMVLNTYNKLSAEFVDNDNYVILNKFPWEK